jgi:hypothetical protein
MPVPPLGFLPFRVLPPAEPYALSDALALLRFVRLPVAAPLRQVFGLSRSEPAVPAALLLARPHGNRIPLHGLAPRERLYPPPVV